MNEDILIRGGRILDPASGIDRIGSVAISQGKIVSLDASEKTKANHVIDARGALILPGLIDMHTHISRRSTHIGLNPDIACIPNGVTMAVDCGSSGVSNYEAVLRTLRDFEIRSKLILHVSAGGQIMSTQFAENTDPRVWNTALFERAFRLHKKELVGLKIRASRNVLKELGITPIKKAVELAKHLGTRLFVHSTDPICSMGELASMLRKGDVLTHMYHGEGNTILKNGKVDEFISAARERGVVFDVAQGQGNLSLEVARSAIAQGFQPDVISTDLNIPNWNSPLVFSLLMTMSKFLSLGMSLEDVIKAVTFAPAKTLGLEDELGTLREGTIADLSVLRLSEKPTLFKDKYGNELVAQKKFEPLATIIGGEVQFQHSDTLCWT